MPVEAAQCFEILLQILSLEMRGDPAEPKDLPELPERQARQLVSLPQGESTLLVEVNGHLDPELVHRHTRGVENVLRNFEVGGGGHQALPEAGLATLPTEGRGHQTEARDG